MKPKLTKDQINALKEAYQKGTWSGQTGKTSQRKPVADTPIFAALEAEKQTTLCFN